MKTRLSIVVVFSLAFLAVSLAGRRAEVAQQKVIPAELIAYAGHGKLRDREMKEIKLNPSLVAEIQDSMTDEILKAKPQLSEEAAELLDEARKLLNSQQLTAGETVLIKGGIINTLLQNASEEMTVRYDWRNSSVLTGYVGLEPELLTTLSPAAAAMAGKLGVFRPEPDPQGPGPDGMTPYMHLCRLAGVPVPPDWAQSGTPWVLQGTLTQNMDDPGGYAEVWTYSHPSIQGGCIALPRGDGGPMSVAGIICQSYLTGAACFWDNKLRGVEPQDPIGWHGQRLVINQLADGSNLRQNCTQCHRGNNVFLIAPDDPTWAKVLRGPLNGPRTGTFTTQVLTLGPPNPTDRYVPVSGLPGRPDWENNYSPSSTVGVCGACHEIPVVRLDAMPPLCAGGSLTDPSRCYGTP